eukprot:6152718-Karenia_brevis.AAC.1
MTSSQVPIAQTSPAAMELHKSKVSAQYVRREITVFLVSDWPSITLPDDMSLRGVLIHDPHVMAQDV